MRAVWRALHAARGMHTRRTFGWVGRAGDARGRPTVATSGEHGAVGAGARLVQVQVWRERVGPRGQARADRTRGGAAITTLARTLTVTRPWPSPS
eukprot:4178708-Prymnesium_polylepis.1